MNKKIEQSILNLERALQRLEEASKITDHDSLRVDGTIQRFEFTFELFWKTLKRVFEEEGIQVSTPRETISRAWQADWIQNEKLWLKMLEDRNITSYVYSELEANQIFDRIHDLYLQELKQAFQFIRQRASRIGETPAK